MILRIIIFLFDLLYQKEINNKDKKKDSKFVDFPINECHFY